MPKVSRRRRLLAVVAAMLVGAVTMGAGPGRAEAAAAFAPIDPAPFMLDPSDSFQRYGSLVSRIEASGKVTATPQLGSALDGPQDFKPTWGLCHPTAGIPAGLGATGFCWDPRDDGWGLTWTPQGISGSWDAQPDGLWEGRKIALASWHGPNNGFARLTFVDYTNTAALKFRDVLLVVPYSSNGVDNFRVLSAHADGVVWYGNTLLVANGGRMHVFSLKHLWAMDRSEEETGFGADGSKAPSARWHRYALPEIGEYYPESTPTGTYVGCTSATGVRPCLNAISLDRRGGNPDSIVSAEYLDANAAGGRAFRWPLSPTSGLVVSADGKVHAEAAYTSPVWRMQGIASDGVNWYIAGNCASGASNSGCIHKAVPGQAPHQQAEVGGVENLSYQPGTSPRLWGLTEGKNPITFTIKVP
ncbi:hypothetical protein ACWT_1321 [Actinoplanes sp. SE50]|uniref:hypothetical protein n=1 Tax=unclassified Actinoplanes TaxID=2626549 RepID=UPI00023EBCCA|nr:MULTISPECIES: hypothetical protein [unclassified Actinoplanes]AEV82339.1 hypothetical protein ACPL_1442 [Actinoplanes sp. SE50/110]ATO80736.1 hypothetical protein ACWT_1321 [Actinoplanes sp. SE50]SLL98144.1 extracellular protein [Actinoplanes sp. SE50/110]